MNELSRRFLYVDESGTPYLNDKRSSFFLLVGISVNGFSNSHSLNHLDDIFRKNNIAYQQSFHAVDLLEPLKSKSGEFHPMYIKKDKDAKKLISDLTVFIDNFPLDITISVIRKKHFLEDLNLSKGKIKRSSLLEHTKKEINFLPHTYSMTRLVHHFVSTEKKYERYKLGTIICETRAEDPDIVRIIEDAKNPLNFKFEKQQRIARKALQNITSIQFASKNSCYPGLALADIIGFALHQRYAQKLSQFKNRSLDDLLKVIDKKASVIKPKLPRDIKKSLPKKTLNKISKIR